MIFDRDLRNEPENWRSSVVNLCFLGGARVRERVRKQDRGAQRAKAQVPAAAPPGSPPGVFFCATHPPHITLTLAETAVRRHRERLDAQPWSRRLRRSLSLAYGSRLLRPRHGRSTRRGAPRGAQRSAVVIFDRDLRNEPRSCNREVTLV